MEAPILLKCQGIMKGPTTAKSQMYYILGERDNGEQYIIPLICKQCYTDSIEKSLSRLHPIEVNYDTDLDTTRDVQQVPDSNLDSCGQPESENPQPISSIS